MRRPWRARGTGWLSSAGRTTSISGAPTAIQLSVIPCLRPSSNGLRNTRRMEPASPSNRTARARRKYGLPQRWPRSRPDHQLWKALWFPAVVARRQMDRVRCLHGEWRVGYLDCGQRRWNSTSPDHRRCHVARNVQRSELLARREVGVLQQLQDGRTGVPRAVRRRDGRTGDRRQQVRSRVGIGRWEDALLFPRYRPLPAVVVTVPGRWIGTAGGGCGGCLPAIPGFSGWDLFHGAERSGWKRARNPLLRVRCPPVAPRPVARCGKNRSRPERLSRPYNVPLLRRRQRHQEPHAERRFSVIAKPLNPVESRIYKFPPRSETDVIPPGLPVTR